MRARLLVAGSLYAACALGATGSFSHVFTTSGPHPYYCVIHGAPGGIGMSGEVFVPVVDPTPPPLPTPTPSLGVGVPMLEPAGKVALALGLLVLSYFVLSRRS
jgi:hypothetical protein